MNLNLNLNLIFSKSMNLNLNLKIKKKMNGSNPGAYIDYHHFDVIPVTKEEKLPLFSLFVFLFFSL